MTLKRKLKLNFGAGLFARITGALPPLLCVPLYLHFLGKEKYGIWLILSAIPAWLSMTDLGFGTVAANEMSLRFAKGDLRGANCSLQSAWVAIIAISIVGMLLMIPSAVLLPWGRWLDNLLGRREITVALLALAATTFVGFQATLFGGILRANGRAATNIFCGAFKPIFDFIAIVIALRLKPDIANISIALFVSQVLFTLAYAIFVFKTCTNFHLGVRGCSKADLRYCLKHGLAFCMFPLGNAFVLQGSLLAVNAALGPIAVVIFGTTRTLIRSAWQLMNMINSVVWPEFSHLLGSGDFDRARRLHRLAVQASLVGGATMVCGIVALGPWVYGIWTAKHLVINRTLLALFSASILTNALWFTSSVVLVAANKHVALAWRYIAGTAVNVPICYILCRLLGLDGGALSTIIVDAVMIPYVLGASIKLTNDSWEGFMKASTQSFRHPIDTWMALKRQIA